MKKLISKLQKELEHLQKSVHKESSEILARLKKLDLKENLDSTRKELEKLLQKKYKSFMPTYTRFAKELRSVAQTAGFDISKWEKKWSQGLAKTKRAVKKKIQTKVAKKKTGAKKPSAARATRTSRSKPKTPRTPNAKSRESGSVPTHTEG